MRRIRAASVKQYAFIVSAERPALPSLHLRAELVRLASARSPETAALSMIAFTGELTETIESFVSQGYFDEVLVTLEDGAVVASAQLRPSSVTARTRMRSRARSPARYQHREQHCCCARRSGAGEGGGRRKCAVACAACRIPLQDRRERISRVRQGALAGCMRSMSNRTAAKKPAARKRGKEQSARSVSTSSVSSTMTARADRRVDRAAGRFGLTVLVLLAPARLAARERCARRRPRIRSSGSRRSPCLISIVLIPAVLGYRRGVGVEPPWRPVVDRCRRADVCTRCSRPSCSSELRRARQCSSAIARSTRTARDVPRAGLGAVAHDDAGVGAEAPRYVKSPSASAIWRAIRRARSTRRPSGPIDEFRAWSPFSSVFATDREGRRDGVRYTVFDAPSVSAMRTTARATISARCSRGRAGRGRASAETPYFAQRLFSGGDGSRVSAGRGPAQMSKGVDSAASSREA